MRKKIGILFLLFAASAQASSNSTPRNYASLEILYWKATEGGADNWSKTISSPGTSQTAQMYEAPFNWNEGLRLSAGLFFAADSDAFLTLTHYTTTAKNNALGIVYSSLDANYFANNTNGANFGPSYSSANINWKIKYNTADISIGHNFSVDRVLSLHPHLDLKFASINQDIKTNWNNPTTTSTFTSATENLKNNFSGVGPGFSVDTLWPIYTGERQSFSIAGNFGAALLYGEWSFSDVYNNNKPTTITVTSDSIRGLSPMINGLLGLQWSLKLSASEMKIRLGYEEQVWLNQMQIYFLDTGKMNRSATFEGGNLEIKLIF